VFAGQPPVFSAGLERTRTFSPAGLVTCDRPQPLHQTHIHRDLHVNKASYPLPPINPVTNYIIIGTTRAHPTPPAPIVAHLLTTPQFPTPPLSLFGHVIHAVGDAPERGLAPSPLPPPHGGRIQHAREARPQHEPASQILLHFAGPLPSQRGKQQVRPTKGPDGSPRYDSPGLRRLAEDVRLGTGKLVRVGLPRVGAHLDHTLRRPGSRRISPCVEYRGEYICGEAGDGGDFECVSVGVWVRPRPAWPA